MSLGIEAYNLVTKFESFLLKKLRNQGRDILKTIKEQKSLSEETET